MNTTNLVIEILVEELPAGPLLKELPNMIKKWKEVIKKYNLNTSADIFYTPRRIVLIDNSFPISSEDRLEEFFGPPVEIAYIDGNKNKPLSKAGEGFCKKCGSNEFSTIIKDNKEILYFSKNIKGIHSKDLLAKITEEFLGALNFGKAMRWGRVKESFIRPIKNICILLDKIHVPINLYGIEGKSATKIHRDISNEYIPIKSLSEYLDVLKKGHVILSQEERKEKILSDIQAIENSLMIKVEIDSELLDEIIAITEYPRGLYGDFDKEFLSLPKEVIITSMKENQRYFSTYKKCELNNGFIVVINSTAKNTQEIISGNQKVLRARLSDAMFFYQNDLRNSLQPQRLKEIAFVEGLGNMAEKIMREKTIGAYLLERYKNNFRSINTKKMLEEALELAKADLLTEMVYEFPELQGLMGYYYSQEQGINIQISQAIKEQYLPTGEESELPSNDFCAIVSMSNKLDTLFGLFSINKIPTGSKDPFALRRATNGIIRIILDRGFEFNLESDLENIFKIGGYKHFDLKLLRDFIIERFEGIIKINPSILRSVLMAKEHDINKILLKALALNDFFQKSDKEAFISTFKRVANITKDMKSAGEIKPDLFTTNEEKNLYMAYENLSQKKFKDIYEHIENLFMLKNPLDEFFDKVMVNDNDELKRENKKNLIYKIYCKFLQIGDIKEIAF